MKHKGYFTTGEFARLCNVEKSTMFFYDRIGLFSPDIVQDNGYRLYSSYRLEEFEMISMFRYMGMSIEKIKKYIKNRNPDEYISILKENITDVDKEMERLKQIRSTLETKLDLTIEGRDVALETISIEERKEEYYFVTPYDTVIEETELYRNEAEHIRNFKEFDIACTFPIGEIYERGASGSEEYEFKYYQIRLHEYKDIPDLWIRPEGRYIKCCHTDGYVSTPEHIKRIVEYAEENNLKIGKFIFEDTLIDEMAVPVEKNIKDAPVVIKLTAEIIEK